MTKIVKFDPENKVFWEAHWEGNILSGSGPIEDKSKGSISLNNVVQLTQTIIESDRWRYFQYLDNIKKRNVTTGLHYQLFKRAIGEGGCIGADYADVAYIALKQLNHSPSWMPSPFHKISMLVPVTFYSLKNK